jgi:hypothetical protein
MLSILVNQLKDNILAPGANFVSISQRRITNEKIIGEHFFARPCILRPLPSDWCSGQLGQPP